jgi:hypothetical protein
MAESGSQPGRRIYTGPRGGVVAEWTYLEVSTRPGRKFSATPTPPHR